MIPARSGHFFLSNFAVIVGAAVVDAAVHLPSDMAGSYGDSFLSADNVKKLHPLHFTRRSLWQIIEKIDMIWCLVGANAVGAKCA